MISAARQSNTLRLPSPDIFATWVKLLALYKFTGGTGSSCACGRGSAYLSEHAYSLSHSLQHKGITQR